MPRDQGQNRKPGRCRLAQIGERVREAGAEVLVVSVGGQGRVAGLLWQGPNGPGFRQSGLQRKGEESGTTAVFSF